jgi:hypothetical protein
VSVRFIGELDGQPLESFRGSVEHAGPNAYLLLGVQPGGEGPRFILDVENVDGTGPRRGQLSLTGPSGNRAVGRAELFVRADGEQRSIEGVRVELVDGARRHVLAGRFVWSVAANLPTEVIGQLQVLVDGRQAGPVPAPMLPFDDHWQAAAVLVLAPGESLHVTLRLPGPTEGTWTEPDVGVQAVWTSMGEALDIRIRRLRGVGLQAKVVVEGKDLAVDLRGALVDDGGPAAGLRLRYAGRLSS